MLSSISYWGCFQRLVKDWTARLVIILIFVGGAVTLASMDISGQYNKDVFGFTSQMRSRVKLIGVASSLFSNLILLQVMKKNLTVKTQVCLCMITGLVSQCIYMLASSLPALYVAAALGGVLTLLGTFINVLKANVATASDMPVGTVFGIFESVGGLANLVGPPLFTALFLTSLKPIFWGHKFPQLIWAICLMLNAAILYLLCQIPRSAYDGKGREPLSRQGENQQTSFPIA